MIHDIARKNLIQEMKDLIDQGVNINSKDDDFGYTPLHAAISEEHNEISLLLIENGADIRAQDSEGLTPLHYAAEYDVLSVADAILKKNPEVLHIEDKHGNQPLAIAVRKSKAPDNMVKLFLKHGADKDHKNIYGNSPFDLVKKFNDEEFYKLFI